MSSSLMEMKERVGALGRDVLLGRLMWYSVTDGTLVEHAQMVQALTNVGLPTGTVPRYPQDYDVFRRVSTDAQRKRIPVAGVENRFTVWHVKDVSTPNDALIIRRVVMETVDQNNHRLDYCQVLDVIFNRHTAAISTSWLNGCFPASHPVAAEMFTEIKVEFARWRGKLNEYAIREWIRKTLLAWGAIPVRPGVYFLPEPLADQVEALETFVAELPGQNECHSLPLLDDLKQRTMVKRALEAETNGAVDSLLTEITKIRREGKLTSKKFASILAEGKRLKTKSEQYAKLLEHEGSMIETRLKILNKATMSLGPLQATSSR